MQLDMINACLFSKALIRSIAGGGSERSINPGPSAARAPCQESPVDVPGWPSRMAETHRIWREPKSRCGLVLVSCLEMQHWEAFVHLKAFRPDATAISDGTPCLVCSMHAQYKCMRCSGVCFSILRKSSVPSIKVEHAVWCQNPSNWSRTLTKY